jgi:DNA-directed RNA polymerase specialized sigma24 family protein
LIQENEVINRINKKIEFLKKKYNLHDEEIQKILKDSKKIVSVPLQIFSFKLSPLESIVKFLKENMDFNFHEIGKLLNRDERTIWITYNNSLEKTKKKLKLTEINYLIPVRVFSNRKFSILESLCLFLIENYNLEIKEIARLLDKNPSSMWTVYYRAKKKHERS